MSALIKKIQLLNSYIKQLPIGWPIFGTVIIIYLSGNVMSAISRHIFHTELNTGFNMQYSASEMFWLAVIAAPLIETLVFQYGIIEYLLNKKFRVRWIIIISAMAFAGLHMYNIFYALYTLIPGILFGYLYFIPRRTIARFFTVFTAHFIFNLFGYILTQINWSA